MTDETFSFTDQITGLSPLDGEAFDGTTDDLPFAVRPGCP